MKTGKIPSRDFASVTYNIPNNTNAHNYDYPSGYNKDNCTLISAKCVTLSGACVDYVYSSGGVVGYYFGSLTYYDNYFKYAPNNTNTSKITFTFAKIA